MFASTSRATSTTAVLLLLLLSLLLLTRSNINLVTPFLEKFHQRHFLFNHVSIRSVIQLYFDSFDSVHQVMFCLSRLVTIESVRWVSTTGSSRLSSSSTSSSSSSTTTTTHTQANFTLLLPSSKHLRKALCSGFLVVRYWSSSCCVKRTKHASPSWWGLRNDLYKKVYSCLASHRWFF